MMRIYWTQRQDFGPSPRRAAAMTFDPVRGRTVLFGGRQFDREAREANQLELLSDTWEWDGLHWTQVSDIGPPAFGGYAMAWDAASQRALLFGGGEIFGEALRRHDTWLWDGKDWTQMDDDGPSIRIGFAVAGDTTRQRVVLFGGATEPLGQQMAANGETWEWDGNEWTQQGDTGPAPRSGHCMAFDDVRGRVVLFGGVTLAGTSLNDTWEWDGTTWTQTSDVGPKARFAAAMSFDGNQTILFGGSSSFGGLAADLNDTWSWDGRNWTQRQDIGPSPRELASLAADSVRCRIVLFGGVNANDSLRDTWELAARPPLA
jgi:hypothetical protein